MSGTASGAATAQRLIEGRPMKTAAALAATLLLFVALLPVVLAGSVVLGFMTASGLLR